MTTNTTKCLHVVNLPWAHTTINEWESEMEKNTPDNLAMIEFIKSQWEKREAGILVKRILPMRFPDKFVRRIIQSRAIVYPALLPLQPFFDFGKPAKKFTFAEELYA